MACSTITYSDTYSCTLESNWNPELVLLPKLFIESIPKPVEAILFLREFVAKKMGLKTAHSKEAILKELDQFDGSVGRKIGLFEVLERTDTKLVTGQDDKHLNFRLTFYLEKKDVTKISLVTDVVTNNMMGLLFFSSYAFSQNYCTLSSKKNGKIIGR